MPTRFSDQEIVATLAAINGVHVDSCVYDDFNNLIHFKLSELRLSHVPPEICQLTNLQWLELNNNQFTQLPPEICQLTNLERLDLNNNQFTQLPPEIGQLTNLQWLELNNNQLTQLPPEICQLTNLEQLYLDDNQFTQLPPGICQLANLKVLFVDDNQLTQLPPEIGQLTNLEQLYLNSNQFTQLPPEIGQLNLLKLLSIGNIPSLLTPPSEIVSRGTKSIQDFLRELQKDSIIRYEAKLLVVGEGGTGKSSLLRAFRNEKFDPHYPTTHGITLDRLTLPHPNYPHKQVILNTWDFGGQHIYHATHQFFLTKRSLYLVIWNARLGVEQCRLHFWLETIKALAPDAPVLLVATHTDERAPDINYQSYQEEYPQLVGSFSVSNKNKRGLHELKDALARHAATIRLMGQPWPGQWLKVEQQLLNLPEHHIDARTYLKFCANDKVDADIGLGTLGNYLHDLGKILYFRDDPVLSNMVVLKPNWVTQAISCVLTDEKTRASSGILSHADLLRLWGKDNDGQNYEPYLYPIFLRLMERFDLSYQIDPERPGRASTQSLVPQLLPYQPPEDVPPWPTMPSAGQTLVEMRYRFDFVPAGIMPWFIVRTHSYTQNMHWQEGVCLQYQGHRAKAELKKQELRLVVWGVQPSNFFTILMNTLDLILARFEGLQVQRVVPCTCHWQHNSADPCRRFYRYEDLVRRMEAGKHEVECPDSFHSVSVPELLYGIHMSTTERVIADIRRDQQTLLQEQRVIQRNVTGLPEMQQLLIEVNQRSELIWRELIRQWNMEMQREELECPTVFILTLGKRKRSDPKSWVSQEYRLTLVCQHPAGPHQVGDGYSLREAKEWWMTLGPWLNRLITILKVGIPLAKGVGDIFDEVNVDHFKNQIALMEEITNTFPQLPGLDTLGSSVPETHFQHDQQVIGPALRALHSFLIQADPSKIWGGLDKTQTPDGNILWLCERHRLPYAVKPLSQQYIK